MAKQDYLEKSRVQKPTKKPKKVFEHGDHQQARHQRIHFKSYLERLDAEFEAEINEEDLD